MDSMPAEELQNTQFDNYSPKWKDKIWGIFGEQDTLAHYEPLLKRPAKSDKIVSLKNSLK